ncbi:MAG: hypothetical protein ACK5ZS_00950 [bacterium]
MPAQDRHPDSISRRLQLPTRPPDAPSCKVLSSNCLYRVYLRLDAVAPRASLALGCPTT